MPNDDVAHAGSLNNARAGPARSRPVLDRADIRFGQLPTPRGRSHHLYIARARTADGTPPQQVDHGAHTPRPVTDWQIADFIKALMQQFIGVQRGHIARREPPEHAMHGVPCTCRDRPPAVDADKKALTAEGRWTERARTGTAALHRPTIHIRAIGEIKRHQPRIPDLWPACQREPRMAWSRRSISRA